MALQVEEFDKRKPFIEWIRQANEEYANAGSSQLRLFVGYNVYDWRLIVGIADAVNALPWALESYPLPIQISAANDFWNRIHEEHFCLFFRLDREVERILVAARHGIWASLDDRFLSFKKHTFTEISDEEAQSMTGSRADWNAIVAEVQAFGISCRVMTT